MAEKSLEPLITECPGCKTRFRVSESQLTMARGRVRCGACLLVFTATDNLVIGLTPSVPSENAAGELDDLLDELARDSAATRPVPAAQPASRRQAVKRGQDPQRDPETDAAPGPLHRARKEVSRPAPAVPKPADNARPVEPVADQYPAATERTPVAAEAEQASAATEAEKEAQVDVTAVEPVVEEIVMAPIAEAPAAEAVRRAPRTRERRARPERRAHAPPTPSGLPSFNLPEELDFEVPPPTRRRWWLLPVTLTAALALVGQVLWFQFDLWSKDLRYRPIYEFICPYVGCELSMMRSLTSIQSRNLVVRSHPQTPGALIVDALLVNEAPYAQPFPLVELRFSSMAGALVAGRRFEPAEYLAGELAGGTMMAPNTPIHISLEIEDPGTDAVNYVMVFR